MTLAVKLRQRSTSMQELSLFIAISMLLHASALSLKEDTVYLLNDVDAAPVSGIDPVTWLNIPAPLLWRNLVVAVESVHVFKTVLFCSLRTVIWFCSHLISLCLYVRLPLHAAV